jgi:uncharacterized protein
MNLSKTDFIFTILMVLLSSYVCSLEGYVNDYAGVFTLEQKNTLEEKLQDLALQTKGVQLVIYTEEYIPERTYIEERTLAIAEENKLGDEEGDNGILFYLATQDREYRWEVGYGAESVLNTPLLGIISRDIMVPYFQQNDYAGGIIAGIDEVSILLLSSEDADIFKSEQNEPLNTGQKIFSGFIILVFVLFLMVFIALVIYASRHSQFQSGGRRGRGGFSSGGFSGRSSRRSSGFRGGGGRFGGGGHSGKF